MAGSAGKVARELNFVRFLWQFNIQIDSEWMTNRQEIICEKRFMTFRGRRTKLIINGGYEDKPKISFNYIKFNTFGIILMKDSLTSADCSRQVFNKAVYSLPFERMPRQFHCDSSVNNNMYLSELNMNRAQAGEDAWNDINRRQFV